MVVEFTRQGFEISCNGCGEVLLCGESLKEDIHKFKTDLGGWYRWEADYPGSKEGRFIHLCHNCAFGGVDGLVD